MWYDAVQDSKELTHLTVTGDPERRRGRTAVPVTPRAGRLHGGRRGHAVLPVAAETVGGGERGAAGVEVHPAGRGQAGRAAVAGRGGDQPAGGTVHSTLTLLQLRLRGGRGPVRHVGGSVLCGHGGYLHLGLWGNVRRVNRLVPRAAGRSPLHLRCGRGRRLAVGGPIQMGEGRARPLG